MNESNVAASDQPATRMVPVHLGRRRFELAPQLATLRAQRPVVRMNLPNGAQVWLVTRYDDVCEVLSDAERFGSDGRLITDPSGAWTAADPGSLIRHGDITQYDPPDHTRLRRMISPAFTAKQIRQLRPHVVEIVDATLDDMQAAGPPLDLLTTFALAVPSLIICELLGVPYADRAEFQRRSVIRFDTTIPPVVRQAAIAESVAYMTELVGRNRTKPGAGLIGTLVRDHGADTDDRELAGIGDILLLGGHETTAHMLALGTLLLLENPDCRALVAGDGDIDSVIEELLRYLTVVQTGVPRVTRTDTTLGGELLRRGDRVLCSLPSANHDGAFTPDGDRFDPRRAPTRHLAFGQGIHYCLGAPLARLELRVALPALLRRLPTLALAVPEEQIRFRPAAAIYGVRSLPVTW
jgi:cytochrome P450